MNPRTAKIAYWLWWFYGCFVFGMMLGSIYLGHWWEAAAYTVCVVAAFGMMLYNSRAVHRRALRSA